MRLFVDLTPPVVMNVLRIRCMLSALSITIYFKAVGFVLSFRVLLLIRILTKQNGLRFSSLGRPLPKVPGTLLSCKNGFKTTATTIRNAKRAMGLLSKKTILHVQHAFLYICTTMT